MCVHTSEDIFKGERQRIEEGQVAMSLGKVWRWSFGRSSCPLTWGWAGGCSKLPGEGGERQLEKLRVVLSSLSLVWRARKQGIQTHLFFQEQANEKTNNGTHYKLQLLYSNGERPASSVLRHPHVSLSRKAVDFVLVTCRQPQA